jgi:hypothetical protein
MNIENIKKVFYHASCRDGTASAMICALAAGYWGENQPKFYSVQYGNKWYESLIPEEGHLFVDITPPRNRWEEWKEFSPVVLDHHISSKYITEGLGGIYGNEDESGAILAYKHIFVPRIPYLEKRLGNIWSEKHQLMEKIDRFAHLISIRDTWKRDSPDWEEACHLDAGMSVLEPKELVQRALKWDVPNYMDISQFGRHIYGNRMRRAHVTLKSSKIHEIKGKKILIFNTQDSSTSDMCDLFNESGIDLSIGYFYSSSFQEESLQVSLRSKVMDVSRISESFGGGGHKNASGFRIKSDSISPNELLRIISERILE